jgi:transposase
MELKDIEIWFQDEARVGQRGTKSRIWAEKGSRPRLLRQQQYKYKIIFGAICAETGRGAGLVFSHSDSIGMNLHLQEISKNVSAGKHAVLILDRASWHTSSKLEIPSNISLLPLPAASPELNPVEQIWAYLRGHYLSNRFFKDSKDIELTCCKVWNEFVTQHKVIKSIGSRNWANLNI